MNVIRHNHKGVQLIVAENVRVITNRLDNHFSDCRLAQIERSRSGFVEQPVH